MRYWRRRHEGFDLESELRAGRPEPAPELISRLEARVRDNGRSRVGSLRVAFVGALTGVMLLAVASVGGVGYASSAARDASGSVKRVLGPQDGMVIKVIQRSPAIDQYRAPAKKAKKAKKQKAKKKKGKGARGQVRARTRPPFTG